MPGLVPGIHVRLPAVLVQDVDGRDKPGHDGAALPVIHPFQPAVELPNCRFNKRCVTTLHLTAALSHSR
jgi:hypothetical protein